MYVIALPVSGGGFVVQLAILQYICQVKISPDLILASSGGNVAAYIAMAADWKWSGIERISNQLNQELFVRQWSTFGSLSFMFGYFKGDLYKQGIGINKFLSNNITQKEITKYEIWTGTYNKKHQRGRLFCNKSQSILDITCIDQDLTQHMKPKFMKGNIKTIAKVSIASASIPAIVPGQVIKGEEYIDGGLSTASPLTVMQDPILKYVNENESSLHIIYINSVDLSKPITTPCNNALETLKQATGNLVRSQTVIDRISGYEMLRCQCRDINKDTFSCSYTTMQYVLEIQKITKYTLLEIYPTKNYSINIVNFNGAEVNQLIKQAYDNCRCRLWWGNCDSIDDNLKINEIIKQCKICDTKPKITRL